MPKAPHIKGTAARMGLRRPSKPPVPEDSPAAPVPPAEVRVGVGGPPQWVGNNTVQPIPQPLGPAPLMPWWPPAAGPATPVALQAASLAGLVAAIVLRLDRPGIGWFIVSLVAAGAVFVVARSQAVVRPAWMAIALVLMAVSGLRASEWLFTLCVLTACVAGSLSVAGGRSIRGLFFGSIAVPVASLRALPWVARGLAALRVRGGNHAVRLGGSVLVSVVLLAIFAALFAGADAAFAHILSDLLPSIDGGTVARWIFLFFLVGMGTAGACYLVASPPPLDAGQTRRWKSLRRIEWTLPVGLLVLLFASFVAVQLAALFGGSDYVLRTAGLTYAEYARSGFWQLMVITVLTLAVIALAARWARTETPADRAWLRGVLGALAGLTLIIVASALSRMWAYQQAYGFTVLRLLVEACELWLGIVYLLVIAAGVRLRTGWLPRAIVGTGMVALIALAALNPDRFIAERNIARWEQTGKIDVDYLSGLSADAADTLTRLPEPQRSCALATLKHRLDRDADDDWRSWNAGRSTARDVIANVDSLTVNCSSVRQASGFPTGGPEVKERVDDNLTAFVAAL